MGGVCTRLRKPMDTPRDTPTKVVAIPTKFGGPQDDRSCGADFFASVVADADPQSVYPAYRFFLDLIESAASVVTAFG